jgi:hypothetical protein
LIVSAAAGALISSHNANTIRNVAVSLIASNVLTLRWVFISMLPSCLANALEMRHPITGSAWDVKIESSNNGVVRAPPKTAWGSLPILLPKAAGNFPFLNRR